MRPANFIVIMADDLGYGDLRSFGNDTIHTPNIDAIGERGVTFTDFHANGAVCSPTRAALLTGQYQQRAGIEGVVFANGETRETGMDPAATHCLARTFRERGYATAVLGKWHLGYNPEFNPTHHGFDHFRGYVSGNVDYHSHVDGAGVADWWDNLEKIEEQGYVTDLVNRHAVDFIEKHKDQPFLLYVAHEAPHFPYQGRDDQADRFPGAKPGEDFDAWGSRPDRKAAYREMIEAMDEGVGWIVDKLRELDLEQDTLIIFCSDNGAMTKYGSNGSLRGQKGQLFEGGHRVPAMAAWPGHIPPGTTTNETVLSMDLLPTCLALADGDATPPEPLDGIDISPALLRQEPLPERDLYWRYNQWSTIRRGRWKYVREDETEMLFDLASDLNETTDLATTHPEQLEDLRAAFTAWAQDVDNGIPRRA